MRLGWSLVSLGKSSEARKTFEDILLAYPGTRFSDPIFWGIFRSYLEAKEVEKATFLSIRISSPTFFPSPWIEQCLFDIGTVLF